MGLIPEIPCSYCDAIFMPTKYQYRHWKQGHNVSCSRGCDYEAKHKPTQVTPWSWLRCKNVMDNLPHWIEPEDIYVGY